MISASTGRHIVVADVESTGLDHDQHLCVEVAWQDLDTGERGCFVPRHDVRAALAGADIESSAS